MSLDKKDVSYEEIFGEIDFKEGQEARSVLSPAAYLADLLQLYEDEFHEKDEEDDHSLFEDRRGDIREILLDEENTFTMIPYLDIVNEILEKRVGEAPYTTLKNARHPINLPFDFDNEKIKNYLKHLQVTPEDVYKLFAQMEEADLTEKGNKILAREYLGLSKKEYDDIVHNTATIKDLYAMTLEDIALEDSIEPGITVDELTDEEFRKLLVNAKVFMRKTSISYKELLELLQQKLHETQHILAENFYINKNIEAFAKINGITDKIEGIHEDSLESWFMDAYLFISLAKRVDMSFTDLDLILRSCCDKKLDDEAIQRIAVIQKLHRDYELSVDVVCSLFGEMDVFGTGNAEEPVDLFNRVYNGKITSIDKRYIIATTDIVYPEYMTSEYTSIPVWAKDDLMLAENKLYRMRLCKALKITQEDLESIMVTFNEKLSTPITDWTTLGSLSLLYRIATLTDTLELSIQELFSLFDMLDDDPTIRNHHSFDMLIHVTTDEKNCYEIIANHNISSFMWLIQLVFSMTKWMQQNDFTAEELKKITSRVVIPTDEDCEKETEIFKEVQEAKAAKIECLNSLYKQFKQVIFSAKVFQSETLQSRTAKALYRYFLSEGTRLVSTRDSRLLLCNKDEDAKEVRHAVYSALHELDKLHIEDFMDTGIEDHVIKKIMDNLTYRGYINTRGEINEEMFPDSIEDFHIATDFENYKYRVFDIITALYKESLQEESGEDVQMSLYLSDFESLGLPEEALRELYDNLIFNHYIDEEERVIDPEYFGDMDHTSTFRVNADIEAYANEVYEAIIANMKGFEDGDILLEKGIFKEIGLTEVMLDTLMNNLWFNNYIDEDNMLVDKISLLETDVDDFNLAIEFYPYRHQIVEAIKVHILTYKTHFYQVSKTMLEAIAGKIVATDIYRVIEKFYLKDGVIGRERRAFFRDKANVEAFDLGDYFTNNEENIIFKHMAKMLETIDRFVLKPSTLTEMGMEEWEQESLIEALEEGGYIYDYKLNEEEIEYFLDVTNALDFKIDTFDDYNKDIFFALHDIAKEVSGEIDTISKQVMALAKNQETTILDALQDFLGIDADIIKAIGKSTCMNQFPLLEEFMIPIFNTVNKNDSVVQEPASNRFNYFFRRVKQIARLIAKLRLTREEAELAFAEQDLIQKYPERLILPEGVKTIDVVLEGIGDKIYLFTGTTYYVYSAEDYSFVRDLNKTFSLILEQNEEDELFKGLTEMDYFYYEYSDEGKNTFQIDAAFIDQSGAIHVIAGQNYYYKEKDKVLWELREREWGLVENNFSGMEYIDASFVDDEGKTYLFSGDQYVRYSSDNYMTEDEPSIDEGYPKTVQESWKDEFRDGELHPDFHASIDGSLEGIDKRTYIFKDDRFICSDDYAKSFWINEKFGKVKNNFDENQSIDAALALSDRYYLFVDDQVICYRNNIENNGLYVEEGFPQLISTYIPELPCEFKKSIDAIAHEAGRIHMFKDGKCVQVVMGDGDQFNQVDEVDTEERWGIVRNNIVTSEKVDAAFVGLDGKTYLFSGNQYYRYSYEDYAKVDSGYPRLIASDWGSLKEVNAAFVLDGKTYLCGITTDGKSQYVCYSTNDYTEVDEDYPKEIEDDWWNLPFSLTKTDIPDMVFNKIDAIYTDKDHKTYLFFGNQYVYFDRIHRWWSEPQTLGTTWGDMPFDKVDAAFTGKDGKTYIFSGKEYIRYSTSDYTRVDDRWPNEIKTYWGHVVNNIVDTGRVDAALTIHFTGEDMQYLYLFSGEQYYRYTFTQQVEHYVDAGYPRDIKTKLREEQGFLHLNKELETGIDAAFSNSRNIYLFKDNICHIMVKSTSESLEEVYHLDGDKQVDCLFTDQGNIYLKSKENGKWHRCGDIDGELSMTLTETTPPLLRPLRQDLDSQTQLDKRNLSTILQGVDGNTYAFYNYISTDERHDANLEENNRYKTCYNYLMDKEYSIAEEWGRVDNNIVNNNTVDAAFVGSDGNTYMFSGHQYVIYNHETDKSYGYIDGVPKSIIDDFGLRNVEIAYVLDGTTYLFEKPDKNGIYRYTQYSGMTYDKADEGFPRTADICWWGIPLQYQLEGFDRVNAVHVEGDNIYLINGDQFIQYNHVEEIWSDPTEVDRIWRDIPFKQIKTLFRGVDGFTYFFREDGYSKWQNGIFQDINMDPRPGESRYTDTCIEDIHKYWGKVDNNIVQLNRIDAALVHNDKVTYLFSGDQYVRYSTRDYRYVDEGYPKKIYEHLRFEEGFGDLDHKFGATDDTYTDGVIVRAIIANTGSIYIFTENQCIALAGAAQRELDISDLGHVRNNVMNCRVDAAFGNHDKSYILSGDQYIRYSHRTYEYVDEGYPKSMTELVNEGLGILWDNFSKFTYDIDAALMMDNKVYLFKGDSYYHEGIESAINDTWGKIKNTFGPHGGEGMVAIDAAFLDRNDVLYVFKDSQYIRYSDPNHAYVDEGYPKDIRNNWGDLSPEFEEGIDGAFIFDHRTYMLRGEQYVRYSCNHYGKVDSIFPQLVTDRWGEYADYLLSDIKVITDFKKLGQTYVGDDYTLTEFLHEGMACVKEPYKVLANIFQWDEEEVKWLKRKNTFLTDKPLEVSYNMETILKMYQVFDITQKMGTTPSDIYEYVWRILYEDTGDIAIATEYLYTLLGLINSQEDWDILSTQVKDEENVLKRDALVPYLIHIEDSIRNARDLYEELLIDVQMDCPARTSRIKEALACMQLYFHRYFIDLEDPSVDWATIGNETEDEAKLRVKLEIKDKLKEYWKWMKNYRVWEANRKVFLYPENYIRPELRDTKTEQFKVLEDEIMQGELTNTLATKAYNSYLDSYGEVSRLTVTGAYLYNDNTSNDDKIIIFGRTKTDPRKYFYRYATFIDGVTENVEWESWIDTELQIESEKVYPVYAFGKTFVFWPKVEIYDKEQVQSNDNVIVNQKDSQYTLNKTKKAIKVLRIYYSYQTLNNTWVTPQKLDQEIMMKDLSKSPVSVELNIKATMDDMDHENIVINCSYDISSLDLINYNIFKSYGKIESRDSKTFVLTPELYTKIDNHNNIPFINKGKEVFESLFVENIQEEDTVAFDKEGQPWFVFDHKGGSFLCKPAMKNLDENVWPKVIDREVDEALCIGEDKYLFSDNQYYKFQDSLFNADDQLQDAVETGLISEKFGKINPAYTSKKVKAAFTINQHTYLIKEDHYVRYEDGGFKNGELVYARSFNDLGEDLKATLDYAGNIDINFADFQIDSFFYHKDVLYMVSGNIITPVNSHESALELLGEEFLGHFMYSTAVGGALANDRTIMIFKSNDLIDGYKRLYYCIYDEHYDEWVEHDIPVKKDGEVIEIDACFIYSDELYMTLDNKYMCFAKFTPAGLMWPYIDTNNELSLEPTPPQHIVWNEDGELGGYKNIEMHNVKLAFCMDGYLHMLSDDYYVRYTMTDPNLLPDYIDTCYVRDIEDKSYIPDTLFKLHNMLFITNGDGYKVISTSELYNQGVLETLLDQTGYTQINGNIANIPTGFKNGFSSVINCDQHLYIFNGNQYVAYLLSEEKKLPYEVTKVKYDIVRLTSSTSYKLSTKLFTEGIEKFLTKSTQEIRELPMFGTYSNDSTIQYREGKLNNIPSTAKQLDYSSANSLYYWELFFHIPYLIAQSLNTGQKFEVAKDWFEYVFDPTELEWWKFLPFSQHEIITDDCTIDQCKHSFNETQIEKYLKDPFDPHAIAGLRIVAYEKAIVMSYIDNIIDWGDMLFTQYTRESINEARMLYILAYDLLGEKPESLGERVLSEDRDYQTLVNGNETTDGAGNDRDEYEFLLDLENANDSPIVLGHLFSGGTVHDSLVAPYFFIPENKFFINYWNTVEDRLFKIRHCMNIMGIKQPLPLFQPPIDPMAIVQAVGSGMSLAGALQSLDSTVPHYRFNFMLNKARDLASKVSAFGSDLLGTLEKKDAEELSILQEKQEGVILGMTKNIKQAQLDEAKENTKNLQASLENAEYMIKHYQGLLDSGALPEEIAQMSLMITGAGLMTAASVAKSVNMFAAILPKPIFGVFTYGEIDPTDVLDKCADAFETAGESINMIGEVIGLKANQKRMEEDWKLQLSMAKSEKKQLEYQINGSKISELMAQHEMDILEEEIRQNESVKTFMTSKFTNKELYSWMAGKLSTLYFQTYKLAHDMAKYAQKAFQFERGLKESNVNYISSMYWDSLRKGLLSGESLSYDLDRMEQAYIETNSRPLEIVKPISLLDLDPLALINLKSKGECEFSLTESLFDYDFQGHYGRQVKTISVSFDMGEGKAPVNATLTQLGHKTIIEPDAKAVKYLLDPKDMQPSSIRADWRSQQQIVLSPRGEYDENNGLFELRYDDDRYLPFEGTGAISRWRLELNGKKGSYNPNDLRDVVINLKYTASQGGESFADAVRGMLKPYKALHFMNLGEAFKKQWDEFLVNGDEMKLTFTRDMFPHMSGSKIDGIYMVTELKQEGKVSMILDSGKEYKLEHGKYVETNGLSVSSNGSEWTFTIKGNINNVKNIGLVFGYKASVM